jgi:hypothetical protein
MPITAGLCRSAFLVNAGDAQRWTAASLFGNAARLDDFCANSPFTFFLSPVPCRLTGAADGQQPAMRPSTRLTRPKDSAKLRSDFQGGYDHPTKLAEQITQLHHWPPTRIA